MSGEPTIRVTSEDTGDLHNHQPPPGYDLVTRSLIRQGASGELDDGSPPDPEWDRQVREFVWGALEHLQVDLETELVDAQDDVIPGGWAFIPRRMASEIAHFWQINHLTLLGSGYSPSEAGAEWAAGAAGDNLGELWDRVRFSSARHHLSEQTREATGGPRRTPRRWFTAERAHALAAEITGQTGENVTFLTDLAVALLQVRLPGGEGRLDRRFAESVTQLAPLAGLREWIQDTPGSHRPDKDTIERIAWAIEARALRSSSEALRDLVAPEVRRRGPEGQRFEGWLHLTAQDLTPAVCYDPMTDRWAPTGRRNRP